MAHAFITDLLARHAAGERSPGLLRQLDLLAWADYHEPWEPPPGATEPPEEALLRELRAWPHFSKDTDAELIARLTENPMLHAEVMLEMGLEAMSRWAPSRPESKPEGGRS